jgi:transposase
MVVRYTVSMPAPLSLDLRERIIEAWQEEGLSRFELAERFSVGAATAYRYVVRFEKSGSVAPLPNVGQTDHLIDDLGLEVVRRLVAEGMDRTIAELRDYYQEETGLSVSPATMSRALARLGLTRKKRLSRLRSDTPSA